jgi:hypothetical protein
LSFNGFIGLTVKLPIFFFCWKKTQILLNDDIHNHVFINSYHISTLFQLYYGIKFIEEEIRVPGKTRCHM